MSVCFEVVSALPEPFADSLAVLTPALQISGAKNLAQELIDPAARGDGTTQLPGNLTLPPQWNKREAAVEAADKLEANFILLDPERIRKAKYRATSWPPRSCSL